MPDKKDFLTVKTSGTKTHEKKGLVLSNLKEVMPILSQHILKCR
jgi:hypothetical protein